MICERCPNQHTSKCSTCHKEPVVFGPKDAIKYFEEENQRYDDMLGYRASYLIDYRANKEDIKALREAKPID